MILSHKTPSLASSKAAFTLIEMVTVIAIMATLMTAGVSLLKDNNAQSRKAGTDLLTGLIERARTSAITSRTNVLLAVAEPGDLPAGDERCRFGLFTVTDDEWKKMEKSSSVNGVLMNRWQTLNTGVILIPGEANGVANPLDGQQVTVNYGGAKNLKTDVHVIGFNSRGGLLYPTGSTPIALRLAEGAYRNGVATPNMAGPDKRISENQLKIGRVTARPYRVD